MSELRVLGHPCGSVNDLEKMVRDLANRINTRQHNGVITDDDLADILYLCDYANECLRLVPEIYGKNWFTEDGEETEYAAQFRKEHRR